MDMFTYSITIIQEDDDGPILSTTEIANLILESEKAQNASGVWAFVKETTG